MHNAQMCEILGLDSHLSQLLSRYLMLGLTKWIHPLAFFASAQSIHSYLVDR
jgi:hypothetical protein